MGTANVGIGLDVKGARVGLPLTTMEGCDFKGPLLVMYEHARAEFAFSVRIVPALVVGRRTRFRSALREMLHTKITAVDILGTS